MKKLNNKGFTLVEIVIVIVIIAILAAMLIPSLTQWIDKSKLKTFTSACGTIKTAASSAVAEDYAVSGNKVFTTDMLNAVSADVGKTVSYQSKVDNATYAIISYNYEEDTIVITDGTFWGKQAAGGAWNCIKATSNPWS